MAEPRPAWVCCRMEPQLIEMATPLLTTKLYIPPVRPELVSRPRLIERLNAGLHRKLTLISAPAGFGKTTLLSEWIYRRGGMTPPLPVAWLSLDQGDNDPARFLAYFIAALQTVQAGTGETALAMLRSSQPPPIESLLTGLINEIAETPSTGDPSGRLFALVLDDFHVITDQQVHDGVTFLLDNLPPQMHLVLSGRADPPWPMARLRARGEMTELRASDLRFTLDEAAAFLNDVMGLGLSTEDIAALDARTEGWIVGLQLAALSMQGRKDVTAFIKAFSASHRFILEYLVEEVLDQQPSNLQSFLLQTSILERMTAPLCDAITGISKSADQQMDAASSSQAILERLEQANLFIVPLDDERRWYRYHHLFADLLRTRLEQAKPEQVPTLHLRASEWYEQNGLLADAVSHVLATGDVERVARLVEGNAFAIVEHGELASLIRRLDALPAEVVCSHPWLCIAYAWVLSYAGHVDSIEPWLQKAEKGLEEVNDRAEAPSILGRIAHLRSYIADLEGDSPRSLMFGREALGYIPEDDLSFRAYVLSGLGVSLRKMGDLSGAAQAFTEAVALSRTAGDSHVSVMVLCRLATLQIWQGQLNQAAVTCQNALSLTREHARREGQQLPATGYVHIQMSRVLGERNDLEAAHRHARRGVELSQRWGQADILAFGYLHLARILHRQQDLEGLLEVTREINQIVSTLPTWYAPDAIEVEVMCRLASGDAGGAFRFAQEQGMGTFESIPLDRYFNFFTFVRLLTAQRMDDPDRLDEALDLLARLLSTAEETGASGYVIKSLVLQAMALQMKGERDQALAALERALSLAEPEGYVRVFIDEGTPMAELLRQTAARGIAVDYVGKLLAELEKETKDEKLALSPLSLGQRTRGLGLRTKGTKGTRGLPKGRMTESLPSSSLIEPLSARELEVLRLLTTSLSSTEVAQELFVSVNTIRSHVKSIYRKLDVHRRMDAVRRAKELELL